VVGKGIYNLFAACSPGLEFFLHQELVHLGLRPSNQNNLPTAGEGGVSFQGSLSSVYQANLNLRTATRVLVRLGEFHTTKFVELHCKSANLAWEQFITPGLPLNLRVTCRQSRLYHSGAVSQRIAEAITDRLGFPSPIDKASPEETSAQRIVIRLQNDVCTLSLDSSGDPLYKRGYRQAIGKAPLRETVAATMLLASGWDMQSPLIDPFCGTGVIPIEGALMSAGIPPGINRRFAFMDWPVYDPRVWKALLVVANKKILLPEPSIYGSDRDAGSIRMAHENAARAGVAARVVFKHHAFSSLEPHIGPGWLVTNPPYGVRVSHNQDLRDLYAGFGTLLRKHFQSWKVAFLCTDDKLATLTRLRFEKGLSLNNGGIPVKLNFGIAQ